MLIQAEQMYQQYAILPMAETLEREAAAPACGAGCPSPHPCSARSRLIQRQCPPLRRCIRSSGAGAALLHPG